LRVNNSAHTRAEADLDQQNRKVVRTRLYGVDLLFNSLLNKGTAFTEQERDSFGLHGLLPPHIGTLENQRERRKRVLDAGYRVW
jgi:malate dehydrogenase (oxaloacetate-decarboxylating)